MIDWKGHAITVNCTNSSTPGAIVLQFMWSAIGQHTYMPRAQVEAMLLGKVVDHPEHRAKMDRLWRELAEAMKERNRAPERARARRL